MKPGYRVREMRAAVRSRRPISFMGMRLIACTTEAVHETRTQAQSSMSGRGAHSVGFVWRAAAELSSAHGATTNADSFCEDPPMRALITLCATALLFAAGCSKTNDADNP